MAHDFGDLHGLGNDQAEILLNEGLERLGKTDQDLESDRKMAPWKITLACWIKVQCGVHRWFSENMNMGAVCNISKLIAVESKKSNKRNKQWKKLGIPQEKAYFLCQYRNTGTPYSPCPLSPRGQAASASYAVSIEFSGSSSSCRRWQSTCRLAVAETGRCSFHHLAALSSLQVVSTSMDARRSANSRAL